MGLFNFKKEDVNMIGQQYVKRKILRQITNYFYQYIKTETTDEHVKKLIKNDDDIVPEIEKYLTDKFKNKEVKQAISQIVQLKNNFTEFEIHSLRKMLYYKLVDFRVDISNNDMWLLRQVKLALNLLDKITQNYQ